jgi:hypothetical protein
VGQTGVPEAADDLEAVIDDPLVDLGVAQLDRAVEELGDQHVLAVGGELDEAERRRARQPGVAHDPQRVVLLLDQASDAVEGLLVLQPPVHQLPAQLVPAVGAQVAARVQLAEQVGRRVADQGDLDRGGAGRAGQAERLDVGDLEAELVRERLADGLAAGAADVEVGAAPAPVPDREDRVRGEQPERQQRQGDAEHDTDQDVGGRVGAEGDPAERGQRHQHGRGELAPVPPSALGDQRVQHDHQERGEHGDLHRRHRPAAPPDPDRDAERARTLGDRAEDGLNDHADDVGRDQSHDEVAQPLQHQQGNDEAEPEGVQHPPRRERGERPE